MVTVTVAELLVTSIVDGVKLNSFISIAVVLPCALTCAIADRTKIAVSAKSRVFCVICFVAGIFIVFLLSVILLSRASTVFESDQILLKFQVLLNYEKSANKVFRQRQRLCLFSSQIICRHYLQSLAMSKQARASTERHSCRRFYLSRGR